jgi:hypothetical protein
MMPNGSYFLGQAARIRPALCCASPARRAAAAGNTGVGTHEESMFMELARLRSLGAAAMIATLFELQRKAQQAA